MGETRAICPRARALRLGLGLGLALWMLGCALAGPALAAAVDPLPAPGTRFQTVVEIAHKQVPLPPGVWQVAGGGDEVLVDTHPGAYGVVEDLVLVKLEGRTVGSFIVIHANALPVDHGWGTSSECAGPTTPLTRIYEDAGTNLFCAFGGPVALRRDGATPGFWLQTRRLARAHNWTLPDQWLMAGFRISDRHDVLEVRYHYQPAPTPLAMAPQELPSGVIAASWPGGTSAPDQGASWLPAWTDWSKAMKIPVEQGFKGRLGDAAEIPLLPPDRTAAKIWSKGTTI